METMHEIARGAINQVPPECRVLPEHTEVIARNADALLSLTPELINGFYETVYGHAPTAAIFHEGERPMREESLTNWWERTVRGPIDENYWAWMSMVGLIHVIRRVTNPMMLSMIDFVAGYVSNNAHRLNLDPDEQRRLVDALRRLAGMTGSVITWGYDHAVSAALFEVAGMPEALLARLRDAEIKTALVDAREEVGNG